MKGLAPHTQKIFDAVSNLPCIQPYFLVGGTALSLQLGTRQSEDLDFMKWRTSKSEKMEIPWYQIEKELATIGEIQHKDLLDIDHVEYKVEGVKFSFYACPKYSPVTNPVLYQNEWFLERVRENYREIIRPYLLKMLEEGIDRYVERIRDSVQMDMLRWDYAAFGAGHYESYENNIRYLKFFLAKRLGFLDEEWLGEENDYTGEGNGQIHTVIFQGDTETETVEVPDGERMLAVPEGLLEEGQWWYNARDGLAYTPDLPVLEDTVFQAFYESPQE